MLYIIRIDFHELKLLIKNKSYLSGTQEIAFDYAPVLLSLI